ncbi:MAG: hypothetical protein V6Z86_06185 [Hyphomicrobiales bacterium]
MELKKLWQGGEIQPVVNSAREKTMPTNLQYLNDPYRFTGEATVIGKGRGEKGGYIELDQTIFYPQGGRAAVG